MTISVTHSTPADDSFSAEGAAAWDAGHVVTGLGTMATQDANNVAITGGAIDGTTIGSTTPAAATFTTLTATGQTDIGGNATSPSLRAAAGASYTSYVQVRGSGTSNPGIRSVGAGTTNLDLSTEGSASMRFYTNAYAQAQFYISHTASAVNYVQVTGAATLNTPVISAQGSDNNVNLGLLAKGAGGVNISTSSGLQFKVAHTAGTIVNFLQVQGAATNFEPVLSAQGSDTNISLAFQSKGTGAIDLAAGSSGVNISNGGTVTAITGTAAGVSYTSVPSVVISAPTTAGGVQATATCAMQFGGNKPTIVSGGTGYTAGDVLTVVGGTYTGSSYATITVNTISGGVITDASYTTGGTYTEVPSMPFSVTGGTGSSATFSGVFGVRTTAYTITNAGSGYVEQPTVTFSGGGGSGAAAYATVGSGTVLKALGTTGTQTLDIASPNHIVNSIPIMRFRDIGGADSFVQVNGGSSTVSFTANGNANANLFLAANGSGSVRLLTNGTGQTEQLRVSHTTNAVNYVQVMGAATGGVTLISAQGSDSSVQLALRPKGSGSLSLQDGNGIAGLQLLPRAASGDTLLQVRREAGFVDLIAASIATDGDIRLTPKGTGLVRFGTYTAGAPTATGYISIKAADGTTYKVLVGT